MRFLSPRPGWSPTGIAAFVAVAALVWSTGVSPLQAQRRTTRIAIDGAPEGAAVYLDAEFVGNAPLKALKVTAGPHTVRVTKPGYTEFTRVVRARRGRKTVVKVDILAVSTVLKLTTTPEGAQVFLDGDFAGETPLNLEILEGEHSLMIKKQHYRDLVQTTTGVPGEERELALTLEEIPLEEREANQVVKADAWYQQPTTWLIVGGAAVVLATAIVLIVVLTGDDGDPVDEFCMGGDQPCVQVP